MKFTVVGAGAMGLRFGVLLQEAKVMKLILLKDGYHITTR